MFTRLVVSVIVAMVAVVPFCGPAAEPARTDQKFENRPGWSWVVEPFSREEDVQMQGENGFVVLVEEGKGQELAVVFAQPFGGIEGFHSFQPIAFDKEGKRHDLRPVVASGSWIRQGQETNGAFLHRWGSDPETLPAGQVQYVGLEGLTIEGWKRTLRKAAREAKAEAKKRGLEVPNFPVVDRPYSFQFTDMEGQAIDSRELKGKVVLLDFWATWCAPCMQKMPKLKNLYKKYQDQGFEVVGMNFDHDAESCTNTIKKLDLPWRHAMAPTDKDIREIWMKAIGIEGLPRLLIIDRDGVLRADCDPDELEKQLARLMKAAPNTDD